MYNCPFYFCDLPCEIKLELMIQNEAECESLEYFRTMQEEIHFYIRRIERLATTLQENGITVLRM